MAKCSCGYECRLPGEQEMLDKWGCARAMEVRQQPFNNIQVRTCDRETGELPELIQDDGAAFKENYMQKYEKPKDGK